VLVLICKVAQLGQKATMPFIVAKRTWMRRRTPTPHCQRAHAQTCQFAYRAAFDSDYWALYCNHVFGKQRQRAFWVRAIATVICFAGLVRHVHHVGDQVAQYRSALLRLCRLGHRWRDAAAQRRRQPPHDGMTSCLAIESLDATISNSVRTALVSSHETASISTSVQFTSRRQSWRDRRDARLIFVFEWLFH
jgi:hypothetical protein